MRRCSRARGAFHRRRPRERSCESPAWSAARVGRRGQPPHVFIGCTKTSTRPLVLPLSRGTSRPRALLRLLQDECFHEHDCGPLEHPGHRICGRGDCPCSTGSPRSRAITEWARGQGSRNNRSSTLRATTARPADFAPTPTVSGASCRGHRSFTLSGVTRGESGTAIARALARLRERQGRATPGFREEVRRSPTRGTFHHEVVRERTKAPAGQTS
jgi:hypothetical protein